VEIGRRMYFNDPDLHYCFLAARTRALLVVLEYKSLHTGANDAAGTMQDQNRSEAIASVRISDAHSVASLLLFGYLLVL